LKKNQKVNASDPEVSLWLDYLIEPSLFETFTSNCKSMLENGTSDAKIRDMANRIIIDSDKVWSDIKTDAPKFDCHKGCSWCCHQSVSVTWPELLGVVRYIRNKLDPNQIKRLQKQAKKKADDILLKFNNELESSFHKIPCLFLNDGECGIHPARPLQCRGGFSEDKDYCIQLLEDTKETQKSVEIGRLKGKFLIIPKLIYNTAQVAMASVLKDMGMKGATYELTVAISIILTKICAEDFDALVEGDLEAALMPENFKV
jgi:Fe-S-cluster containining protein